jgi:PAS domain S-box-containing protein
MSKPQKVIKSPTILVVDDTLVVLKLLTTMLKEFGYQTEAAASGTMAIQSVHRHIPDLILLDINMPGMSGYEVCRTIKEDARFQEIPIIFLSGLTETINKVEGFSLGAVDFVAKPVDSAELRARIETHLAIHRLQVELQEVNSTLEERVVTRTKELLTLNTTLQLEILERKRLEKSLKEGHEKYRMLFESMTDGFALHEIVFDDRNVPVDYRFLEFNPAYEKLMGLQAKEVAGKTFREVFPGSEEHWVETYGQVAITGRPVDFERYFQDPGKYFQVNAFCPRKGTFATVISDITPRKMMEESLQESEEKYRALVENSSDIISRFDRHFCRLYVSPSAEKLFQRPVEEIIGKSHRELGLPPDLCQFFEKNMTTVFETRQPVETEFRLPGPNGETPFECRLYPEFDESGEVNTILSILRDISEQKKAHELLTTSNEQLRALTSRVQHIREEEKRRISRQVHDELGQILTALNMDISWFESRMSRMEPDPEHTQLLGRFSQMKAVVSEAIRSVRNIAQELRPVIIDDLGLVAAIEWQLKAFQARTGVQCDVSNEYGKGTYAKGVSTTVFRIFQESMTNIARHAKATRVKIKLLKKKNFFIMEIIDNGQGIVEENLRFPSSLGILDMKERAHEIGGEVELEGKPGEGTIVRITIPEEKMDE